MVVFLKNSDQGIIVKRYILTLLLLVSTQVIAQDFNPEPMRPGLQGTICSSMIGNLEIEDINDALVTDGRDTFENEYPNIKCSVALEPLYKVGPFRVLVNYPSSISSLAKGIFMYFHKTLGRMDLLAIALNTPDKFGRTVLDYHAEILKDMPPSAMPSMSMLRKRLCAYGGKYSDPEKNKNCKIHYQ
jgi:hypothetical protein